MSKPRKNTTLADMSLPPEERGRRRTGRVVVTPPAQMDHASGSRAARQRRDGERWLAAEQRARGDDSGTEGLWQDMPQDEPDRDAMHAAMAEAVRRQKGHLK